MKAVVWNVRVDAGVDPIIQIEAVGWYEACTRAATVLGVNRSRIHVSQVSPGIPRATK